MPDSLGDRIRARRERDDGLLSIVKEEVQEWARDYTDHMRDTLRTYADNLRDALKVYVDNQNTLTRSQSKTYVDNQIAAKIAKLATDNGLINNP